MPRTVTRVRSRSTSSLVGADADVGGEQRLLDLVPGVVVEVVAGEQGEQALRRGCVCDRASRARSRTSRPATASGVSIDGAVGGARRLLDEHGVAGQLDVLERAGRAVARDLGVVPTPGA